MDKHLFRLFGLSAVAMAIGIAGLPVQGVAQDPRTITIAFNSIRIVDEDDPISNDEPYLIVTKVRMRVQVGAAAGTVSIVPGTLQVANVMSGHNNLGRGGDNWADEPNTYNFPNGILRSVQENVPWNEPGWVIGAIVSHVEEDGFSNSTANLLGTRIEALARSSVTSMSFSVADARGISDAIARKVVSDLGRAFRTFDLGGIIRGIASAADPDDFGGVQVVLTATGPGNTVFMYAGVPPASIGVPPGGVLAVTTTTPFSLKFPTGVSALPSNARFCGDHRVNGDVRIGRLVPLF